MGVGATAFGASTPVSFKSESGRMEMIKFKYMRLVFGFLFILSVGGAVSAQRPGRLASQQPQIYGRWIFLGQANVDGRVDRDRISVGRGRGRFQRIQIRVDRAPIEFYRVVVHYANGQIGRASCRERAERSEV